MLTHRVVDITELAVLGDQFPLRLMQLGYRLMQVTDEAGTDRYRYVAPPVCDVPAGPFLMGSDKQHDPGASDLELPQHEIVLPAFQIGVYPVTVAEYACALHVGAVASPKDTRFHLTWQNQCHQLDHPVGGIIWSEAMAYAAWLSQVTQQTWRLPTEAEWEKAARGTDERIYPWGDVYETTRVHTYNRSDGPPPMPVGCEPQRASPYGVQDLVGTVWQWTSSWYMKDYPYQREVAEDEANIRQERVIRGGYWSYSAENLRLSLRGAMDLDYYSFDIGMRLVRSVAADTK